MYYGFGVIVYIIFSGLHYFLRSQMFHAVVKFKYTWIGHSVIPACVRLK